MKPDVQTGAVLAACLAIVKDQLPILQHVVHRFKAVLVNAPGKPRGKKKAAMVQPHVSVKSPFCMACLVASAGRCPHIDHCARVSIPGVAAYLGNLDALKFLQTGLAMHVISSVSQVARSCAPVLVCACVSAAASIITAFRLLL